MALPMYYTVYLSADDTIVAFGPVNQCCKMLGMTRKDFLTTLYKIRAGKNKKYEYYAEPLYPEQTNEAGECIQFDNVDQ